VRFTITTTISRGAVPASIIGVRDRLIHSQLGLGIV